MGEDAELDVLAGEGRVAGLVVEGDEDGVVGGVIVLEPEVEVLEVGSRGGPKLACLVDDHVAKDLDLESVLD